MRRLLIAFTLCALAACNNFEERLDDGCDGGANWSDCPGAASGGGTTSTGGGTTTGGGSATGGGSETGGGVGPTGGGTEPTGGGDGATGGGIGPTGGGTSIPGGGDGTTGGGSATTGGGSGPTGGGTGIDAGPGRAYPEASCVGLGAWCWDLALGALGSTDIFAIWGTSNTDVFAAGSGGALFHWDGTRWRQVQLPGFNIMTTESEPAIRAIAGSRAGSVVISGEQMPVYGLTNAGAWAMLRSSSAWRPAMAATSTTLYIGSNDADARLETVGSNDMTLGPFELRTFSSVESMGANANEVFVALAPNPTGVPALRAYNAMTQWPAPGAANVGAIAMRDGLPVMLFNSNGNDGSLWVLADGGTMTTAGFTDAVNVRSHAFSKHGNDWWWWLADEQGQLFALPESAIVDGGILTPTRVSQGAFDGFNTSWVAPTGEVWVGGSGGRVVRLEGTPPSVSKTEMTVSTPAGRTYDVDVSATRVVLSGQSGLLRYRDLPNGAWVSTPTGSGEVFRGVSLAANDDVWTVSEYGQVFHLGEAVQQWAVATGDGGFVDYVGRNSGIDVAPDGTVCATFGGALECHFPDGGAYQHKFPGKNHSTDVIATNDGTWVAVSASATNGEVFYVPRAGTPTACSTAFPLGAQSLSMLGDGGVLVAGQSRLARCTTSGASAIESTIPSGPSRFGPAVWVSYIEDVRGERWVLAKSGDLYRNPGTGWVRERTPAAASAESGREAWRLRGNGDSLFIGAGSGNLLRRPLP